MLNFEQSIIAKCIVHKVGNSYASEKNIFATDEMYLTDSEYEEMKKMFIKCFKGPQKANKFSHSIDINQNVIYKIMDNFFNSEGDCLQNTKNIVTYLFEQSTHYSIKSGEVFIIHFNDVSNEDGMTNAIGIFKVETPSNVIITDTSDNTINMFFEKGIISKNIEKACIVLNADAEDGYTVYSYEKNSSDTNYWNKNFLNIKKKENDFNSTTSLLESYREFVINDLPNETLSKKEKIEMVNQSVDFVNDSNDFLSVEDFIENTIKDSIVQNQYRNYLEVYKEANEIEIDDNIKVSYDAVKYQQKKFKSVIKLDKNFHVYIHGNDKLIENGIDENGMKYYKLYYENEQ